MIGEYSHHQLSEAYMNHTVFAELEYIGAFYSDLSDNCFSFIPNGVSTFINYTSFVYSSIGVTTDSISMLLKVGRINDAFVLLRKYFDDVLLEIFMDALRKEKLQNDVFAKAEDVDMWIQSKHRVPSIKKIIQYLKNSECTKDIYPFFGWDTYFKETRQMLDDCMHGNAYSTFTCNTVYARKKEPYLQKILMVLKQIFKMHLAFVFYLNPYFFMASDYRDYLESGLNPPEGSEKWIAPFAQEAFDKYMKNDQLLACFIKERCSLNISLGRCEF